MCATAPALDGVVPHAAWQVSVKGCVSPFAVSLACPSMTPHSYVTGQQLSSPQSAAARCHRQAPSVDVCLPHRHCRLYVPVCTSPCANGGVCSAPDTCDCTGTGCTGATCTTPGRHQLQELPTCGALPVKRVMTIICDATMPALVKRGRETHSCTYPTHLQRARLLARMAACALPPTLATAPEPATLVQHAPHQCARAPARTAARVLLQTRAPAPQAGRIPPAAHQVGYPKCFQDKQLNLKPYNCPGAQRTGATPRAQHQMGVVVVCSPRRVHTHQLRRACPWCGAPEPKSPNVFLMGPTNLPKWLGRLHN